MTEVRTEVFHEPDGCNMTLAEANKTAVAIVEKSHPPFNHVLDLAFMLEEKDKKMTLCDAFHEALDILNASNGTNRSLAMKLGAPFCKFSMCHCAPVLSVKPLTLINH